MEGIELDNVDLISLDSGQAYFAGRQHNMMPIMAESYEMSCKLREALKRDTLGQNVTQLLLNYTLFPH